MLFGRRPRKLANILQPRGILCVLLGFFLGCVFTMTTIRRFTEWRVLDATVSPIELPMSKLSKQELLLPELLSVSLSPNAASVNLASKTETSIRILCMILTTPNDHAVKARAVKQTWASRCDDYFFVSSENDTQLPAYGRFFTTDNYFSDNSWMYSREASVRGDLQLTLLICAWLRSLCGLPLLAAVSTENRNQLWDKTKFGVIYAATQYGRQFDYLFKADDDTYAIMENLRKMLEEHPKKQSIIMGRRFKPFVQQGYPSGGAGYVISRMGVDKIAHGMLTEQKCGIFAHTWTEDVRMGQCAEAVGVTMVDSLDAEGLERFHPFPAFAMFNLDENNPANWLTLFNYHKLLVGRRCCSNYSITFHYIKPPEMFTYDFLLYHMHTVFNKEQHDLPEK
ncbi:glycoprotein-N-acetylgalactosamine 3-beta-galactosyltransferase [Paragonimus westermani]|uniref:N-acetylgalactosaminide beta-1,3-galactosyltransferase n=1 Tax=Paragonimus westermani TaxID=34504 RepID=A0A5J4NER4_9TREM|nr:glycoprotein-N-acetylgalactosamine 3-beta-galactosyltransferase [Paragonimus westermani]